MMRIIPSKASETGFLRVLEACLLSQSIHCTEGTDNCPSNTVLPSGWAHPLFTLASTQIQIFDDAHTVDALSQVADVHPLFLMSSSYSESAHVPEYLVVKDTTRNYYVK